jgi:hypothetical protein
VLADPGAGEAGVLPSGAGTVVPGDAAWGHAELKEALGRGRRVIGNLYLLHPALGMGDGAAASGCRASR